MKKFIILDKDKGMIDIKSIIFLSKRLDGSLHYIQIHTEGGTDLKLYYYEVSDRDAQYEKLTEELKKHSKVLRKER